MRTLLAALALTTLAYAGPALAGPAEDKSAKELSRLILPEEAYRSMLDQLSMQLMATMGGQAASLPPDAGTKIKAVVKEAIPYEEMVQMNGEIYATKFTAAELGEMIKFYKTPVGRKSAKLLPEISGESMRKFGPVLMGRLPGLLKKHGLTPKG